MLGLLVGGSTLFVGIEAWGDKALGFKASLYQTKIKIEKQIEIPIDEGYISSGH